MCQAQPPPTESPPPTVQCAMDEFLAVLDLAKFVDGLKQLGATVPWHCRGGCCGQAMMGLLANLEAKKSPEAQGTVLKTIAQGVEMGRPSLLNGEACVAKS